MWGWIIKVTLISLLLIFLLHYLYSFFKSTLTSPKVKDMIVKPQEKYDELLKTLKNQTTKQTYDLTSYEYLGNNNNNNINTKNDPYSMKNELKNYLKELKQHDNPTQTINNGQNTLPNTFPTNEPIFSSSFNNGNSTYSPY